MDKKTICVTGKATVSMPPDCIKIYMELSETIKKYEDCVISSAKSLENLKSALNSLGFSNDDIKTIKFNIRAKYDYTNDTLRNKVFLGYKYTHKLYIKFENDSSKLNKILSKISKLNVAPSFKIEYTMEDFTELKTKLLNKAVEISKFNAEILTKSANVTLGDILKIDYSWGEVNINRMPYDDGLCDIYKMMDNCNDENIDLNITPEDIELSDTVTITWEIL